MPAPGHHGADSRVEVRAADRAKHLDQNIETTDRRCGVGEQGDGHIPARQAFGHDARANHHRQQQCRAEQLGEQFPMQIHLASARANGRQGLVQRRFAHRLQGQLQKLPHTIGDGLSRQLKGAPLAFVTPLGI